MPNFTSSSELSELVMLIPLSANAGVRLGQKECIPEWSPDKALNILLDQAAPHNYRHIIMTILKKLSDNQKSLSGEIKQQLRDKAWLYVHNQRICPMQVILMPQELQHHLDKIVELSDGEYISNRSLQPDISNILKSFRLMTYLRASDILDFILKKNNPHLSAITICDSLQQAIQNLGKNTYNLLRETPWIPCLKSTDAIAPSQVIQCDNFQYEIEDILAQSSNNNYVSSSQIDHQVAKHSGVKRLINQQNLFIQGDRALSVIGPLLKDLPEYWIGKVSGDHFGEYWPILPSRGT